MPLAFVIFVHNIYKNKTYIHTMIQKVIKRDGRTVDFNFNKIEEAIRKAMDQTDKGIDAILAATIADRIAKDGDALMTVEAIQD